MPSCSNGPYASSSYMFLEPDTSANENSTTGSSTISPLPSYEQVKPGIRKTLDSARTFPSLSRTTVAGPKAPAESRSTDWEACTGPAKTLPSSERNDREHSEMSHPSTTGRTVTSAGYSCNSSPPYRMSASFDPGDREMDPFTLTLFTGAFFTFAGLGSSTWTSSAGATWTSGTESSTQTPPATE